MSCLEKANNRADGHQGAKTPFFTKKGEIRLQNFPQSGKMFAAVLLGKLTNLVAVIR